jgi:Taurine catabolism dioxygenase TauD, TfdA family
MTCKFLDIIEADSNQECYAWLKQNRRRVQYGLEAGGAVLLRGLAVSSESHFQGFVQTFSQKSMKYLYRSTPRTNVAQGIYTATEYPPGLHIPLHNENAYQRDWPLHVLFFCMHPAQQGGGQTPLADTVSVTNRISPGLRKRFSERGVMYVRNYCKDIDLPWQVVFQTDSRSEVEAYCAEHDISCEWTGADCLRTRQVCQAVARHPNRDVVVWFNQAHLFHPSALDQGTQEFLRDSLREEDYPRNALYGDGSRIGDSELDEIRAAFNEESRSFMWQSGDTLILDNMLISHGRTPYKGRRRVLVGMCDPYSEVINAEARNIAAS